MFFRKSVNLCRLGISLTSFEACSSVFSSQRNIWTNSFVQNKYSSLVTQHIQYIYPHLKQPHQYIQQANFTRIRKRLYKWKGKEPQAVRISGGLAQKWVARYRCCRDGTILRYRAGWRHKRFAKTRRQKTNLRKIVPVTKRLNKWLTQLGLKWFRKKYPNDYLETYLWPIPNPSHALRIRQLGYKYPQVKSK
eukprot:TRINITY_DN131_c2_g1_i1.p2 TRINITY_DN131_c2_g1~~TRINITY_DN131_c2_g1_i1.p2  ORF type:complete len:206 (-),score=-3.13 TRINITY_DN131_c2_g1_i1:645-1220(-)